jgi:hypothetical protein
MCGTAPSIPSMIDVHVGHGPSNGRPCSLRDDHEAVQEQRVLVSEQLGEKDTPTRTVLRVPFFERIVGPDRPAKWRCASSCSYLLELAPEVSLGTQQLVALPSVLLGFARKAESWSGMSGCDRIRTALTGVDEP